MTDYHNYNKPSEGASDWHIPLNDNFEQLDSDVEIRDTKENRTDYDPKDGAKFLATDTGARYVGNRDSWEKLPVNTAEQNNTFYADPDDDIEGIQRLY
jgi:hypothetical protein